METSSGWLLVLLIIGQTTAISYNRPKFCRSTAWNSSAVTLADNSTIGPTPFGIFVNTNNTVYAASPYFGEVLIWFEGYSQPNKSISGGLFKPYSLFVTDSGDIYVDNGNNNSRVDKWMYNTSGSTPVMYVGGACLGLFIDINNTLYCSMQDLHQVVKRPLSSSISTSIIAAGAMCPGPTSTMLYTPQGIFVDTNLDLYVADCGNNRIQRFKSNQLNGTTVAGNGASNSVALRCPSGVVLDADGYLFIVDANNHRIIGSGPDGFRCLAGCFGQGSTADQLSYPGTLSFDRYGNMFVTDWDNARIQKFFIATNSCDVITGTQATSTPYASTNAIQSIASSTLSPNGPYYGAASYNRPIFGAPAAWNSSAVTFADINAIGSTPYGIFVNSNNTVYIASSFFSQIQIWSQGSNQSTRNISDGLSSPKSLFVSNTGDVYVDNGFSYGRVDKWAPNAANSTPVMYTAGQCDGLFIDINNNLYCSMTMFNQVVAKSLSDPVHAIKTVAGSGCSGGGADQLFAPSGIFVDTNLDLYVADTLNNRIQVFTSGNMNGTTKVGGSIPIGLSLLSPRGVVLDANSYLFIVDTDQNRIVGQGPTGFQCIAGCVGAVSQAETLYQPWTMAFDNYGNIYVTDKDNSRIQIFVLASNDSGITTMTTDSTTTTSMTTDSTTITLITTDSTTTTSMTTDSTTITSMTTDSTTVSTTTTTDSTTITSMTTDSTTTTLITTDSTTTTSMATDSTTTTSMTTDSTTDSTTITSMTTDSTTTTSMTTDSTTDSTTTTSMTTDSTTVSTTTTTDSTTITSMTIDSTTATSTVTVSTTITTTETSTTTASTTTLPSTIISSTTIRRSPTLIVNNNCRAPNITFVGSSSTFASPLQYLGSQHVYIMTDLQLKCITSLSTIIQWTVKQCSSICSTQIQLGPSIITTRSELFIPANTLLYGTYELQLIVTMTAYPNLTSTAFVYVEVIPSSITSNVIQFGTSMIVHGYQQDLTLNPGTHSIDPDSITFNTSNWDYEYYCRIYDLYNFPTINGSLVTIDDFRADPFNSSCLSNQSRNGSALEYHGAITSPKSSLTILPGSLPSNTTYQIMVIMTNRQNSSVQSTGYLLVRVEDSSCHMIALVCVISTMCIANLEYQYINPTTQVALFSACLDNCTTVENITWNIYQRTSNASSNMTQWTRFNQMNSYRDIWFFGMNTSNFTATDQLFIHNPSITYWRFEVVYSFASGLSSSALNFIINQPPQNGSCSINPPNGTTTTLFTISCVNWSDKDRVKDYSFYGWTTDPADRVMLAFSSVSNIELVLPAGNDNASLLHIVAYIRDTFDCVTEFNLSSVIVQSDWKEIDSLQNSTNSSFMQMLAGGNQNRINQVMTSLSQQLNQMNDRAIDAALANGVSISTISISSLDSRTQQSSAASSNASALAEYNKQLNMHANLRDSLVTYMTNLTITTVDSIKLQASSLAQFTQATNQLTRNSLMLASNKCYQLALALYSKTTKISYDEVQTALTYITQCASNVLSAVNGPLQQRTTILDLDWSRANNFPADYDTDLEADWSKINLFADQNDFSWKTIEKGRNNYYQKQLADQITSQTSDTMSLLTNALHTHLNIGQNLTINSSSVFLSVETASISSLSNKLIQQIGNTHIRLPSSFSLTTNGQSSVSLRSMMQPLASVDNSRLASNTNLSRSVSLTVFDRNGNEVSLQTNVHERIELIIPRDPTMVIPSMTRQNVSSSKTLPHYQLFNLHFIQLPQSKWNNNRSVSLTFEMKPWNTSLAYLLIYRFDNSPQLNSSINQLDGWALLCPSNLTNDHIYQYFLSNQETTGRQSVIFGLRELNSTEYQNSCQNQSTNHPPISNQPFNFTADYELRTYTACCYYLDQNKIWRTDDLLVGPLTNHYQTQCLSTHLTTFAGGFLVLPAPINWNYVFANADFARNKTVYLTVICVCVLYLLLVIYARYKDKKDLEKLGVTPLPDNYTRDQYFYQILVFTGHRKYAGTDSKVHFILAGDEDETSVRTFSDPHRKVLQRGGIDAFIMAVPKSLGSLNYIRVWHDNSGQGTKASWFLKYIIVRDLQTLQKSYFICQQWFAVEKDEGQIERLLPIAGDSQKQEFSYILSKQAYHSMSDGHLWFSIFSRPPSNIFTRVQRCTCCFVLLFTAMLLNILYYDQTNDAKASQTPGSLSFGPFHLAPEQISIGIIVEILSFVPSLLLIQLFRRTLPRRSHQQLSPLHQALAQLKQQAIQPPASATKKRTRLMFPWWAIFIAYGLSFILVAVSSFFIVVRGIQFGDLKTQKWLTSLISGFVSSILLIQPLKIAALAIFFNFFLRNSDKDKEAAEYLDHDNDLNLGHNEEYLHSTKNEPPFAHRSHTRVDRLNKGEVVWARDQRLKEIRMWAIIREVASYLCFLTLIYLIAFSNMNPNAFFQVNHLRKFFLNIDQIDHDYTKISTIDQYWNWLENSFASNLRAQQWYNGQPPRNLSGFIDDKSSRLIGWAVMRQLRVKMSSCHTPLSSKCNEDYSFFNEDKHSFEPGWVNQTTQAPNSSIHRAFMYQNGDKLDTYMYIGDHGTYSSGGYVYEYRGRLSDLQGNLSELHRLNWIDSQTRAVLIQLTLYNPNVELFTSLTLLVEFLSTGGLIPQYHFEPLTFQVSASTLQLVCTIVYMVFILYNMVIEIQNLIQLKSAYWRCFWTYINVGIIGCSWGILAVYIWRYQQSVDIGHRFQQTNGYVHINLQFATYVNGILTYLLGFCCFFSTLKFLRLCRFHQRLSLFTDTLQHARGALFSFIGMFFFVFMAFLALFYLMFLSQVWGCSTLLHTAQMLFEMMLMKFDANELINAAPLLGPLCFCLFILLVVFVCMNMFITIISDSFRSVRDQNKVHHNEDQAVVEFMFNKVQRWLGLGGQSREMELVDQPYEQMRGQYCDPIEGFPNKIDQLLDALNRVYTSQQNKKEIDLIIE